MSQKLIRSKFANKIASVFNYLPVVREDAKHNFPDDPNALAFAQECDRTREALDRLLGAANKFCHDRKMNAARRRFQR